MNPRMILFGALLLCAVVTSWAATPGTLQFVQTHQDAFESRGVTYVQIERTGGANGVVQVGFATEDGSATAGDDYSGINTTITFRDGETKKVVPIILLQHSESECARGFKARLFDATGEAVLGPGTNVVITLFDDDVIPRGTTECISVTYSNALLAAGGGLDDFTDDGRYVLFRSPSANWFPGGAYDDIQLFVHDTSTGFTEPVTVNLQGNPSAGIVENGDYGAISANGRYVAFTSAARDLTTNIPSGLWNVYVRDLLADRTTLVSVAQDGISGDDGYSWQARISSNGNIIAFASTSGDLIGDQNLFVRDMTAGVTRLVTKPMIPTEAANDYSTLADITPDGRFVLFWSFASNLVGNDTNGSADIFVRDLLLERTLLVSANAAGTGTCNYGAEPGSETESWPKITADGRFVVFTSVSSDLVAGDTNESSDVFIRDLVLGTTRLVSINAAGTAPGNSYSYEFSVTPDARFVAFSSRATDLTPGTDIPHDSDNIFVRDLVNGTTELINSDCGGKANGWSFGPWISADGRYVTFFSLSRDLVPGAFLYHPLGEIYGRLSNVYRHDRNSAETILISANYDFRGGGNESSRFQRISRNGKAIAFGSGASNLSASDSLMNGSGNVFLWREFPGGPNADVRVTSTVNPLRSGMVINLRITNFGPDSATAVVLEDTLSGSASFISAETTLGSCTLTGPKVTCPLGTLARRAGAVITLVVAPVANGSVSHTATVSHGINDPLPANGTLGDSAVLTLPPSATLWVSHCRPRTFVQWLSAPPEFQLESGVLGGWSPVTSDTLDNGIVKTLMLNDAAPPAQFYRLRRP